MAYFQYGEKEIEYLKSRDKKLAVVIDRIGHINREVHTDLFTAVVHHIVAQQISSKALVTVWGRFVDVLGEVTAENVLAAGRDKLQQCGISYRKADYIIDFAAKVSSGEFDLDAVEAMSDEEAIKALSALKGIGVWTAEMLLLFCCQRPDVFSYGDYAIRKGVMIVYHHKDLPKERFERYRRRFSPYCSVASLYFWAVAGGALDGID